MRIAIALSVGTITLLITRIYAGHIGLFSMMWWAWIGMQVFTAGAAGFTTALALVHHGYLRNYNGIYPPTDD